jgi:putative endonuclease
MTWYVYILLCDQQTFYVGITSDIEKRFHKHKLGLSLFTKKFADIKLVYKEEFNSKEKASRRELQLKRWSHAKKKALIEGKILQLQNLARSTGFGGV